MEYAEAAKHPFTDEMILSKAFLLMQKTGQFKHAYREWNKIKEQTWTKFKDHFTEAHLEFEETEAFASANGYGANHLLEQATNEMVNLMSTVTEHEDKHQEELANLTKKNRTLEQELATLKQLMYEIKQNLTTTQSTTPPSGTPANQQTKEEKLQKLKEKFNNPDAYCWSHGYTGTDTHTRSQNCKKRIDGHQPTATKSNTMDGNTTRARGFWTAQKFKK
jgi:hypothetical protein